VIRITFSGVFNAFRAIQNEMWKTNSRHWERYRGSETAKFAQWEIVRTSTLIHHATSHLYFFSYFLLDRKGPNLSENILQSRALSARVRAYTTSSRLRRFMATSWTSRLFLRTVSRSTRYYIVLWEPHVIISLNVVRHWLTWIY